MKQAILAAAAATVLCFAVTRPALAQHAVQTLTFDEVPTQSVNGLSVKGVRFEFRVGGLLSPDARYNAEGPGALTFLSDPVLEGDAAGILTLNFAAPTPLLNFGLALTSTGSLAPAATIQLFDLSLSSVGVFSLNTEPLAGVSEAQFRYTGAPILRAVIDFNENALPDPALDPTAPPRRFALDNLAHQPIPEPGTLVLLGTGIAALAGAARRRRRRAPAAA